MTNYNTYENTLYCATICCHDNIFPSCPHTSFPIMPSSQSHIHEFTGEFIINPDPQSPFPNPEPSSKFIESVMTSPPILISCCNETVLDNVSISGSGVLGRIGTPPDGLGLLFLILWFLIFFFAADRRVRFAAATGGGGMKLGFMWRKP
ncbi:hypothetical protein ACJIZ3_011592 [Penstemon smallii]|uniref:Uncharacterized protein n=1 Tax=Penstemon smallii TaxID=265156 RepID=A0ABD3UJZ6_9LAMI